MSRPITLFVLTFVYLNTIALALVIRLDVGDHTTPGLRWNVTIHEGDTTAGNMALKKLDDESIPSFSPGTYILQFTPVSSVATETFETLAPRLAHEQVTSTFPSTVLLGSISPSASASDTSKPQLAVQKNARSRIWPIIGGILGGITFIGIKGHLLLYRHRRLRKKRMEKVEKVAEKDVYRHGHVQPFTALSSDLLANNKHLTFSSSPRIVSPAVLPSSAASVGTSRLVSHLVTTLRRPARSNTTHVDRFVPPANLPTPEQTNSKRVEILQVGSPHWEKGRAQAFLNSGPDSASLYHDDNVNAPESMFQDSLALPTTSHLTNRQISEELAFLREQIRRLETRQEQLSLRGENPTNTEPPPGYEGASLPPFNQDSIPAMEMIR